MAQISGLRFGTIHIFQHLSAESAQKLSAAVQEAAEDAGQPLFLRSKVLTAFYQGATGDPNCAPGDCFIGKNALGRTVVITKTRYPDMPDSEPDDYAKFKSALAEANHDEVQAVQTVIDNANPKSLDTILA